MRLISFEFLLLFVLVCALFYACPRRKRWYVLCAASLLYYLLSGIFAFIFILITSLSSYIFAFFLQKYRKEGGEAVISVLLTTGVMLVLLLRGAVKLFLVSSGYHLVLGISFYSLRVISYLIEVKRGRLIAERSFFKYLLFVSYFPLALQGPVALYGEISESLYSGRGASSEDILSGLLRSLFGIFKKLVIANALALPVSLIVKERYSGVYVILLLFLYTAEIYCDFSGGMDIVLGLSRILGVALPENFDRPFSSLSLREFWNRWHITLGAWFERYVFYPVSLSKPMQRLSRLSRRRFGNGLGKRVPVYTATMLTWLMTGLWHGARSNYIAWGLINGALVLLSDACAPMGKGPAAKYPRLRQSKPYKVLCMARVFLIIGAVRLLDVYGSPLLWVRMLSTVFYDFESYVSLLGGGLGIFGGASAAVAALSLGAVFFVGKMSPGSLGIAKRPLLCSLCIFGLMLISLVFGTYGEGFDAGEFIYSRF